MALGRIGSWWRGYHFVFLLCESSPLFTIPSFEEEVMLMDEGKNHSMKPSSYQQAKASRSTPI